ncbi:uncharacterized protein LOC6581773 [Drosophila mojavensis]|uniref:Thioredoxin domain-containing protein n=1 Tax=Drosophila mojavensis TaxID=7230 RepID=B4KZV9_DROMO|nr:uncharacterized protein LOC6581773 [Drosophila mojavensis]EDW17971.2 uncharacterized protein Dmoj_GI12360 [Drosophila mojavensis]
MILFVYIWIGIGLLPLSQAAISECPTYNVPLMRAELEAASEVSLVFYYVSWSSDARQARLVYDGVAHYYKDYASFGAVDCWHLQCNCSRTHRQLPGMAINGGYPDKWPTLVVNYGRKLKLQYQGAWHFEDLTRFMNNLIQPIDRIHITSELGALWRISDAVVLALLESADSQEYRRFLATAIHWLEFDPERNVRFAVTFGQRAKEILKLEQIILPQLVLIDNRYILHSYNKSNIWRPMEILHWIRPKVNPLQAAGYGTPAKIAIKARHMPVLAMSIRMRKEHSAMPLAIGEEALRGENVDCEKYSHEDVLDYQESRYRSLMQMPMHLYEGAKTSEQLANNCYRAFQLSEATLTNYYSINEFLNYLWSHHSHENDLESETRHLMGLHKRNRCLAHTHSQQGTPALKIGIAKMVAKYSHLLWQHSTAELSHNRSLAVVLFDGAKYRDFLQQLGVDQVQLNGNHRRDSSGVQAFIVDAAAESVHVMPQHQTFTYQALTEFIKQFYARQLPRVQRNHILNFVPSRDASYIQNYNRHLLLQALQRANATNVVLIHRPDCELSAIMSQEVMQVAALLRSPDVNFIRFNSQANDLPWELTMSVTPALLVFPQSRPTESAIFPIDMRVDTANVMSFILAQLEPEQQLRLVLASCRRRLRHARSCLDFAGKLVLQHVSQYLRYWEIFVKERDIILSHLKQFNEMHIAIESSIKL